MPEPPIGELLITGATGFLGAALVRRLVQQGVAPARMRCLVRDARRAESIGLPRSSLVVGDLGGTSEATLASAVAGAETVLHLAGALKGCRAADFDAVNVHGTARLVAAVEAHAKSAHFVCVSSLAAAGPSVDGDSSAVAPDEARPVSLYGDSKRRGELAVVRSALPWTIVRPPVVYGPGDAATRLLFRQARMPFTMVPLQPRPLSVVHVDDVVRALVAALRVRPVGAILPLDGPERTDTHAFVRAIAAACGRSARFVKVPMLLVRGAAAACDLLVRLGRPPGFFGGDKVREIAACGWVADDRITRQRLGTAPAVGLAEGLAAVAAAEGFVQRSVSAAR